jgi:hypothetical protein
MGIEPTLFAWEARVLPLNDTRNLTNYKDTARQLIKDVKVAKGQTLEPDMHIHILRRAMV